MQPFQLPPPDVQAELDAAERKNDAKSTDSRSTTSKESQRSSNSSKRKGSERVSRSRAGDGRSGSKGSQDSTEESALDEPAPARRPVFSVPVPRAESQVIESTSDIVALGRNQRGRPLAHPHDLYSQSPNISWHKTTPQLEPERYSMYSESSFGLELAAPRLQKPSSRDSSSSGKPHEKGKKPVKRAFITRNGSCALDPFDYAEGWGPKDPNALTATRDRMIVLRDWIDHHAFIESSLEALNLVNWKDVSPTERRLLAHHAGRRAIGALMSYRSICQGLPWLEGVEKLAKMSEFAYKEDIDPERESLFDLDILPPLAGHDVGIDDRLPRTIVVLAKIYHRLLKLSDERAEEAGQWIVFRTWLNGCSEAPNSQPDRDPRILEQNFISDNILEHGASYIVEEILKATLAHNSNAQNITAQSQGRLQPRVFAHIDDVDSGVLPPGCVDICKEKVGVREIESKLPVDKAHREEVREERLEHARKLFRRSLAYRAKTLNVIRNETESAGESFKMLLMQNLERLEVYGEESAESSN